MFFRNLTLFRFPPAVLDGLFQSRSVRDVGSFHMEPPIAWESLALCAMKPVGPLELSSRGFISPFGRGEETLSHRTGDAVWITVGGEDKILPGSVVNDLLAKKLEEIERKDGRKPGGRTRKRIKEDLLHELLPKAFVKPSRTDALIDLQHRFIAVDTASRKSGEAVVSEVRRAFGSFPALPLNAEVSPRAILTGWVAGEPLPDGLRLGEECELKDPMDGGAVIKCQQQEMQSDEIAKHLEARKQVTRLALTLDDHVSFVLGEDLVVRKLRFLDGAIDQLENAEREDLRAELDARFALMAGEVSRLFLVLESALKLSKPED